ncbi:MAG TPA: anti-sigma factor [Candidatus Eisenbacteria bacterium]|nr:anti-sigma factor [Candidatus Eisenbacteria bacterium]
MSHEIWLELAEIYALGTLGGEDLKRFQGHLAGGCPECEALLKDTREALSLLPASLAPVTPSPLVKKRVMEAIGGAPAPSACGPLTWAMAAAAALLTFLLVSSQTQLAAVRGDVTALRAELEATKGTLKLLTNPHAQVVRLDGLKAAPQAVGTLIWDAKWKKGFFLGQNLPETPIGKVYELWAIEDGKPLAAGTFSAGPSGRAMHEMPDLPEDMKVDTFAVTIEPVGGTPQPTGAMVLLGKPA